MAFAPEEPPFPRRLDSEDQQITIELESTHRIHRGVGTAVELLLVGHDTTRSIDIEPTPSYMMIPSGSGP